MERLTKAALATAGAAALLVGGAGTLAFWTASGSATGTAVESGTLTMVGGACADWTLDGGGAVTEGIVPGDTITTDCTMTIGGTGDHLGLSEIQIIGPAWSDPNALTEALDVTIDGVTLSGEEITLPTEEAPLPLEGPSEPLVVTLAATFDELAENDTQELTATLADVTVQVTQAHVVPAAP